MGLPDFECQAHLSELEAPINLNRSHQLRLPRCVQQACVTVSTAETQSGKRLLSLGLWASGHTAGQAHWLAGQPLIHLKMVNFVMLNQKPTRQVHLQRHACRK